jgi:hypothetical protein
VKRLNKIAKKILKKIDTIIKNGDDNIHITGFVVKEKHSKDKIPLGLNYWLYTGYRNYLIYLCNSMNSDIEVLGYSYKIL